MCIRDSQGAESVYSAGVGAGHVRPDGKGTRGYEKVIEGLPGFRCIIELPDQDPSCLEIHLHDLVEDPRVDSAFRPEFFRSDRNKLLDVVDDTADIIGNGS